MQKSNYFDISDNLDEAMERSEIIAFHHLSETFTEFRDSLPENMDIAVSTNGVIGILEKVVLLCRRGLILLEGRLSDGLPFRAVQTLSRPNLTMLGYPRKEDDPPRQEIGFAIRDQEFVQD